MFGGHVRHLSKAVFGFRFLAFSCQLSAYTVFGFLFSVKKVRIISKLKLKLVAFETELGITA